MWCCKCNRDLSECVCPDLQERLRRATGSGHVAIKWCRACDKSYHQCRCAVPDFYVRSGQSPDSPKGAE